MDFSDKWLGKMGGGISGSLVGGFSAYQFNMWNMAGGSVPIPVLVVGKRLGIMAQLGAGHAFCLMTGVHGPESFTEIESSGIDWELSLGGDADAAVKSIGGLGKELAKAAGKTGNWAVEEGAKKAVQAAMGDFSPQTTKPNFVMIPTPLAVGVGAGVFYEWQTLSKVGSDVAWRYIKPSWRLANEEGGVKLYMDSIPEKDGTMIGIQIMLKTFGPDSIMVFSQNRTASINFGMQTTNKLKTIRGTVHGGALCEQGSTLPGLNLSSLVPAGKLDIGILSTSNDSTVSANTTLKIGVSVTTSATSETNLYKWQSGDYAAVKTGADGKFKMAEDSSYKT